MVFSTLLKVLIYFLLVFIPMIADCQSFPLTFIHPNQTDSARYEILISKNARNSLDTLDEIDTLIDFHADIKGYNWDIATAFGLTQCAFLRTEAKPEPQQNRLTVKFSFKIASDTLLVIPPHLFPAFGIVSWDSTSISKIDTINGQKLRVAYVECFDCNINNVDQFVETLYANTILGVWINPESNLIIYAPFSSGSCPSMLSFDLVFEYETISGLHDHAASSKPFILQKRRGEPLEILNNSQQDQIITLLDLHGREMKKLIVSGGEKRRITNSWNKVGLVKITSNQGAWIEKVIY